MSDARLCLALVVLLDIAVESAAVHHMSQVCRSYQCERLLIAYGTAYANTPAVDSLLGSR